MPEPDILDEVAVVPGVDGRKMSKSYGNTIDIFADDKALKKSVISIVTDSAGLDDVKSSEGTPLFEIYSLFLNADERAVLKKRFTMRGVGYGHIKQDLLKAIQEHFAPYRERRARLESHPADLNDILASGAKRAREAAEPFLERARIATGLYYGNR
jgi:tryptophanyl-tRNA synthetase